MYEPCTTSAPPAETGLDGGDGRDPPKPQSIKTHLAPAVFTRWAEVN